MSTCRKRGRREKTFVTLFPDFTPVCFGKDNGMIPAIMQEKYGYKSMLICQRKNVQNGLDQNLHNLGLEYIDDQHSITYSSVLFLLKNARKIDVLNLYYLSLYSCFLFNLYKLINPSGIAYLKADLGYKTIIGHEQLEKWKVKVLSLLQKRIDIVSAESNEICERYSRLFNREVVRIPNGFYRYSKETPCDKEKVLLTVARLGTEPKATDVLLEAFARTADKHDWKLRLVGPIEHNFQYEIKEYYNKYPELKDRVDFPGNITDKVELEKEYEQASIFVLPSRWEGFPLVLPEAIAKGCYLIVSDQVTPAKDLICNEKHGKIVPVDNIEELADAIVQSIDAVSENNYKDEIMEFAKQFEWQNICNDLDKLIKSKKKT